MYRYLQKVNCYLDTGDAYHVTVKETILDPVWHATY